MPLDRVGRWVDRYRRGPLTFKCAVIRQFVGNHAAPVTETLGRFGADAKPAIPYLIEIVSDKNEPDQVRIGAAVGLAQIGTEAKVAIPKLKEILKTLRIPEHRGLQFEIIEALDVLEKSK